MFTRWIFAFFSLFARPDEATCKLLKHVLVKRWKKWLQAWLITGKQIKLKNLSVGSAYFTFFNTFLCFFVFLGRFQRLSSVKCHPSCVPGFRQAFRAVFIALFIHVVFYLIFLDLFSQDEAKVTRFYERQNFFCVYFENLLLLAKNKQKTFGKW